MKKVLTIAGSDSSGGAGIQADIKTITAHKMYAMSAITALTAQNTTGVYGISEVSPQFVAQQIDCIFNDIRPDSVKIGMVSSSEYCLTADKTPMGMPTTPAKMMAFMAMANEMGALAMTSGKTSCRVA